MFKEKKLITYRSFEDKKFPVLTIPQGTVLFRYAKYPETQIIDFAGKYDETLGVYNLSPDYNAFFYFYPYVIDTNKYIPEEIKEKSPNMIVYVLTKDINVLLLIKPSAFSKSKKKKFPAIISCEEIVECNWLPGIKSDICFKQKFSNENPDIHGKINIVYKDNVDLQKAIDEGKMESFKKFLAFFRDSKYNAGVPEVSLYPRTKKEKICITTKLDLSKGFEWIRSNIDYFNYFPLFVFSHLPYEKDKLYDFLNKSFKPEGYKEIETGKVYHLGIDKRTYFYILYEAVTLETLKYCEDSKNENKLKILRKSNPDLILDYSFKITY